jgi:hypothetical protein
MSIEEGFYVLGMLAAYVMRRVGTLTFGEKVLLIRILAFMVTHPDASYRVRALGSGRTIERLDQFQYIMPSSSHLFLSDTESTGCSPGYQSEDNEPRDFRPRPGGPPSGTIPG